MPDWDKIIQAIGPHTYLAMFLTAIGALLWIVQQIISIIKGFVDIKNLLPAFSPKSEMERKAIRRDRSPAYMLAAVIGYRIILVRIDHTGFSGETGAQALVGEVIFGFLNCVLCTVVNAIFDTWSHPIGVFFISALSLFMIFAISH